jgi:hypothetical protein
MIAFFLAAVLTADSKPTAEQVAKAVVESQTVVAKAARNTEIRLLNQRVAAANRSLEAVKKQRASSAKRSKDLKEAKENLAALEKQLEDTKIAALELDRLADLDLDRLENGAVGVIRQNAVIGSAKYELELDRVLKPNRALIYIRKQTANDYQSYSAILVGHDTSQAIEDKPFPKEFAHNVVVVGRSTGSYGTVPVLEVFDPAKPFKSALYD